ncbi:MAG: hypothetical protein JNJ90_16635 [Saprospiraceae bacterium]|nr:hypothetical protein [Saprospiraceae bacterium]
MYFTNLSLTGTLAVTSVNAGLTGTGLSEVNVKESVACTSNFPGLNNPDPGANSPLLSYSDVSNVFTWQVSSNNPLQPVLNWPVYGRMPVFTLAVDVFPGETVQPVGMVFSFTITDQFGANPISCNTAVLTCTTADNLNKSIAQPSNQCNTPWLALRIGEAVDVDPPQPGFPNRKRAPVWVYAPGSSLTWGEVDFLMTVASSQNVPMPIIEGGLLPVSAVRKYAIGGQYRLYANHKGTIQIQNGAGSPNSGNTLFYIVLDGPQLESECAEVTLAFTGHARLDGGSFNCCKPQLNNEQMVSWNGPNCISDACPEITLKAVHNSTNFSNNCGDKLKFDLQIVSTQNTELSDVRGVLKVKKTGSFSLDGTLTTSPYCSPASCITVTDISSDYLRVEYDVVGIPNNLKLFANQPKLLATIVLTTSDNGCISGMDFLDAAVFKTGSQDACVASGTSSFSANNPNDDICSIGHILQVGAESVVTGEPIPVWYYYVNYRDGNLTNCRYNGNSPDGSTISRCVCILPDVEQNVVLKKDNDWLNGVSTFDLVRIQQHILGLNSLVGFQYLAADANMSGSVSTFDQVELRKLILGIYQELPASYAWRFVDKNLKSALENSTTPFIVLGSRGTYGFPITSKEHAAGEFATFALPPMAGLDSKAEFVGFKVGDVNGNSTPNLQQESSSDRSARPLLTLGTHAVHGRTGQVVEIPVFGLDRQFLQGWQVALGFDTSLLRVTGVRWGGDIPPGAAQDRGWHLAAPGELRLLWYSGSDTYAVEPGKPLFFVQAELLRPTRAAASLLHLQLAGIPSEAYADDHSHFALQLRISDMALLPASKLSDIEPRPLYSLSIYPNPSAAMFRLEIEASAPCEARLNIADALGRTVHERILNLVEGRNDLVSMQLPALAPGAYLISLHTPVGVETLRLVRR